MCATGSAYTITSRSFPGENMKIAIDMIKVDNTKRIRTEIGDLQPLEESIKTVGLINPLVIDEKGELLAGFRRLNACKNLGIAEVEVIVVDVQGDEIRKLEVELAENFYRKDFTPEEILASEERRRDILESMREKSVWERCWTWLKNVFSSTPQQEKAEEVNNAQHYSETPAQEKPEQSNREDSEPESSVEKETEPVDSDIPKESGSIFQEATGNQQTPLQNEGPGDDEHAIKWRS